MNSELVALAARLTPRALAEAEQLVAISSPSGDIPGAQRAIELCAAALPPQAELQRLTCATDGCAPDLLARLTGTGTRRLLLLGHLDTVFTHAQHRPPRREPDRLHGSGTIDMKGGVALSLALARELAQSPSRFAELALLLVCDEEWRTAPFAHAQRFAGYDACLCFEAGERTAQGEEAVIIRRKGAGTLRVRAQGRAAHSGAAPAQGRSALLALARTALELEALSDPDGPAQLTVVPTVIRCGEAFNVVPADGELVLDVRSSDAASFRRVLEAVPVVREDVSLSAVLERVWPAMDSGDTAAPVLARAAALLGAPVAGAARGGASDASHLAQVIPLTIDGLGPCGAGAHTPQEHLELESVPRRLALALALSDAILGT